MSTKGFMLRMSAELHERISATAKANDRSINAEINARLEASFNEGMLGRLNWLFSQVREAVGPNKISISILAESIGEETPTNINRIFSGLEEPSFNILDKIARFCCSDSNWLKHGQGKPFAVSLQINYDDEFYHKLSNPKVQTVHIVRSDTPEGQILIVSQISDKDFVTYNTTINLSDRIGETGRAHQLQFRSICERLARSQKRVEGYIVDPELSLGILTGDLHPLLGLKNAKRSLWVDDWWDREFLERRGLLEEYWCGFNDLVRRIHDDPKMSE